MEIILAITAAILGLSSIKKPVNTIGFRQNNPFNIENNYRFRKDYAYYDGERFINFYFLDDGLEAGYRLLLYYFKNTDSYPVSSLINRYSEGDINYKNFIINELGKNSIDRSDILQLGGLIVRFENGTSIEFNRMYQAYKRALRKGIY
jgi:hypothetical protein